MFSKVTIPTLGYLGRNLVSSFLGILQLTNFNRSVISSKHGGCVIIPREDGYIRLVQQFNSSVQPKLISK